MDEVKLSPPQDLQGQSMSLEVAKRAALSPEKLADLEKQVKQILDDEIQNTGPLRRRLNQLNDMLEGVVQEVNYPFPNASNVDTRMMMGTARTLRSTMVRALFPDPDRVFIASIPDDEQREQANKVEAAFNWKAGHESGLIEALKDALIPTFRDGTAFIQGIWEKKKERVIDYRTYVSIEDFTADYPTPESAGVSEDRYNEILERFAMDPEATIDVCFEHDIVKKDDAVFSVVTLPRFHWWPLSAKSMDDCELYGVRMEESEAVLKKKRKTKEYWQEATDAVLTAAKNGNLVDQWDRSRDFIEGISRQADNSKRKDFENFRLVLTIDLDDDDIPEKYMGVFNRDSARFLNFDRYKIRNNIDFLVPMRFDRRDDRLLGRSLAYDGMDLFQEITDIHRHRNNNRMISDATCFKAEDDLKDTLEADLNSWRPGLVVWLPKGRMNSVTQFENVNRSTTQGSLDEENSLRGYVEFVIGPTQGLSGQETKGDSSAPATKHLSKIRQAGFRIDDYIDEFKRSFPAISKLALALYYQYGSMKMAYQGKDKSGAPQPGEADRAFFGLDGLTLDLNARSVIMSPEFEMERIQAQANAAAANPAVAANPAEMLRIFTELWNSFVTASRAQNAEKLKLTQVPLPIPVPPAPGEKPGAAKPAGPPAVGGGLPPLKSLVGALGMGDMKGGTR